LQAQVLERALKHVRPGGTLAYATCSLFLEENASQIANFLTNHPEWRQQMMHQWPVDEWGDGFFCAHLTHCE
jgi:16S rRNA (cytosine967-C5)-methyltransferase